MNIRIRTSFRRLSTVLSHGRSARRARRLKAVEGERPATRKAAFQQRNQRVAARLARPPLSLTLLRRQLLDPLDPQHNTWSLLFSGRGAPDYDPGDILYLRWRSRNEEVNKLLDLLAAPPGRLISYLTGSFPLQPGSLRRRRLADALRDDLDIHEATPELRDLLWNGRTDEGERPGGPEPLDLPSLHEELRKRRIDPATLVALLGRNKGRSYTITGFWPEEEGRFRLEITVSEVTREASDASGGAIQRPGRATQFLTSLDPGEGVEGWILPERHHFPVTLGRKAPTVVVCTGSGVSGLMALLRSGYTGGPLWVIYGVRSWKRKALYGGELDGYVESGEVKRLDVAVSRPEVGEGPSRRVQGVLWAEREALMNWIRDGAHFYVSGRLSMGKDVERTVATILFDQGFVPDLQAASTTIERWKENLRYQATVSGV